MGRVGLLGRLGAGSCPNLLQRRPGPGSAARRTAEYQRFSSRAPTRSGPLQQIWTNGAAAGPRDEDAARLTATTTGTPTTRRAPDDRTGSAGTSRPRSDDGDAILTVGRGSRERRPAREDARPRPARAPWAARRRAPRRARSSLDPRERTSSRRSRGLSDVLAARDRPPRPPRPARARRAVRICCKGPDRTGAPEEKR